VAAFTFRAETRICQIGTGLPYVSTVLSHWDDLRELSKATSFKTDAAWTTYVFFLS
jgi:hypothetical protein